MQIVIYYYYRNIVYLKVSFGQFCKVDKSVSLTATSPMNEHEYMLGRPYGGCAILWNSNVKYDIVKLSFNSKRLCVIKICLSSKVSMGAPNFVVQTDVACDVLLSAARNSVILLYF